jgi:hypothetical protein
VLTPKRKVVMAGLNPATQDHTGIATERWRR